MSKNQGLWGYPGHVDLDDKSLEWIEAHKSFASEIWMSQIIKIWPWHALGENRHELYHTEVLPRRRLRILFRFRHFPDGGPHC